jgi:hypothetical protein
MITPNIYTKEKEIISSPSQTTTATAIAMLPCTNGMAMQEVIINNADELVSYFGEPTAYNFREWFQVWNFLQYSSPIIVVRVLDTNTTGRATVGSVKFDLALGG